MSILPEQKPDSMQIWPLGHGIVATTVAGGGGKGMFILAGVPDALEGKLGQTMDGDPAQTLEALIAIPGNQSCVLVYPHIAAIDATISSLTELKTMMGDAA